MKIQAKQNVAQIYSALKRDRFFKRKNFNDIFLYNIILEDNKKFIDKKEYKKLKVILNKELNDLFAKKRFKRK